MLAGGGSHDTVPLMFLVGVNTGVSQICCAGPGASVALQIQGCVVGILAVINVLAVFLLDGCHSAPSCLVDQVLACLVAHLAIKNKVNSVSGTLVQLIVSWGDPEVGCLQYVQEQQSGTKIKSFPLLFPSSPQKSSSVTSFHVFNRFYVNSTQGCAARQKRQDVVKTKAWRVRGRPAALSKPVPGSQSFTCSEDCEESRQEEGGRREHRC